MGPLTSLAEEILENAKRLDQHLSSSHLEPASFDNDSLVELPPELEATRKTLIDATQTLKQLSQGPVGTSMEIIFNVCAPPAHDRGIDARTSIITVDRPPFSTSHL